MLFKTTVFVVVFAKYTLRFWVLRENCDMKFSVDNVGTAVCDCTTQFERHNGLVSK